VQVQCRNDQTPQVLLSSLMFIPAIFVNALEAAVKLGLPKSEPVERVGGAVANRLGTGAVDAEYGVRVEAVVKKLGKRRSSRGSY
jgi:hypothetical protein